jgi:hypothetical protein
MAFFSTIMWEDQWSGSVLSCDWMNRIHCGKLFHRFNGLDLFTLVIGRLKLVFQEKSHRRRVVSIFFCMLG